MGAKILRNKKLFDNQIRRKMKTFLIQYNIKDDSQIKERIKTLGPWMSYFDGFWLVDSDKTSKEIFDIISQGIPSDYFLILEINIKDYWGWMPPEAWTWLLKRKK